MSGPWANGGGVTHTIAAWPPHARLSVADIAVAGPFSRFDGQDRWLAVIDDGGAPLRLGAHELRTGLALAFPGDVPIAAIPAPAGARVFNLIVRRGVRWEAAALAASPADAPHTSPAGLLALFAPAAPLTVTIDGTPLTVPRHTTALVVARAPITTQIAGGGPAVRIWCDIPGLTSPP